MASDVVNIFTVLRSPDDWARAVAGDSGQWSYDPDGALPVEPEVFAARAGPNVWSPAGRDLPPKGYPARAVRQLSVSPPRQQERQGAGKKPNRTQRGRIARGLKRDTVYRSYLLTPEAPEKIDCLCEVYRMTASQVVNRLIDDAYRRDVVESGILAVLGDDVGIIAPRP